MTEKAWAGLFHSFRASAATALDPAEPLLTSESSRSRPWTPLTQALDRFRNGAHRFSSEEAMDKLAPAMARLESRLRSAAKGVEDLLAPDFRGLSIEPARETSLRDDSAFRVGRAEWADPQAAPASAQEFAAALRRYLAPHAPLKLADLACLTNCGSVEDRPARIHTRMRFELAGPAGASSKRLWQAIGVWQIDWDLGDPSWKIAAWRPVEMVTVEGQEAVFADVTEPAFSNDPSYRSHFLRDTNYWRSVLDKASGFEIFGNSGVSVGDADGDGRDEIYLCQPQGLPNRLYRQRVPGIFEDLAREAGVDLLDNTSMALFADILNRGRQDLIVITETSPVLFLNNSNGRFTLQRDAFPPGAVQAALTGAAMADYDRDGYLDLYVCAYGYVEGEGSTLPCPYYDAHNGPPNRLFHNQGDGTFVDVTTASGLDRGNDRFSFACAWNDIDEDGWPDLAVVNDFGRNNLYRNLGNGTFEEVADALPGFGSGMSAAFADFNGDGRADLYVSNMWVPAGERVTADAGFQARFQDLPRNLVRQFAMGNALYTNSGGATLPGTEEPGTDVPKRGPFTMIPDAAGAGRGRWAWSADAFDLENDGGLDLYVVNGYLSSSASGMSPLDSYLWEEVVALSPRTSVVGNEYRAAWSAISRLAHEGHPWNGNERNVFFLNVGDGRFADISAVTGLDFRDDGRAFAVFDFDGDGDADLVLRNRTGPQLRLLRNDLASSNRSFALRLQGTKGNRDAIGARIEIETPGGRQVRFLGCGSGFLSQHSKELVVGLGRHAAAARVRVRWPNGGSTDYQDLEAGYRYFLIEGERSTKREPLAVGPVSSQALPTPRTGTPQRVPKADQVPARFSTNLLEPLPVTLPEPLRGARLLWLWRPDMQNETGLDTLLRVHKKVPSQLVLWGEGLAPTEAVAAFDRPPWRADQHFRALWTTLLAYLYDHRRDPVFPTGLLLEAGDSPESPAPSRLVKVYWGGAEAAEIMSDAINGVPSGEKALPFPGRAILCSFRRDLRTLGAGLAMAGLYPEAEFYSAQAVEANPKDAEALYNLAIARERQGKIATAMVAARGALDARPQFPQASNLLGVLLSESGRDSESRPLFEQATQAMPDFVEAWNNLGYLELNQSHLTAAAAALGRALELAPGYTEALNNLGILRARQNKLDEAQAIFERVLTAEPDNTKAANNLAVVKVQQGRPEDARRILEDLLARDPDDPSTALNLARLDLRLGQRDEARRLLEGWLARHPEDRAARRLLDNLR